MNSFKRNKLKNYFSLSHRDISFKEGRLPYERIPSLKILAEIKIISTIERIRIEIVKNISGIEISEIFNLNNIIDGVVRGKKDKIFTSIVSGF